MALDKVKQGVIADDAVGSSQIAPDTVVAADIGANAITASELADNAVDADAIASNAVTTAKILNANITTAKIADTNITAGKLHADITAGKVVITEVKPHIIPGVLQPAIDGKLLNGANHSGAYGTAQTQSGGDGHKYYYTNIKGSKPIKDPRIGAHFGSQRYRTTSLQVLEQESATHGNKVYSVDGREWMRFVQDGNQSAPLRVFNDEYGNTVGSTDADGHYIEITGYFNSFNLAGFSWSDQFNNGTVYLNGTSTITGLNSRGAVNSPLGSRYVDPTSLIHGNLSQTSPAINTIKIAFNSSSSTSGIRLGKIELIAQDTASTARRSEIKIPAQNVVSFGKKFEVGSDDLDNAIHPHYNPFNGFTSGNLAAVQALGIDTDYSLGLNKWLLSGTYYKPFNGGRVVKYVDSTGTIKTAVTVMPPNAKSIANNAAPTNAFATRTTASHYATNNAMNSFEVDGDGIQSDGLSEVAKTFNWREFGNGAVNGNTGSYADASMLNSSDDISYVMDDGLTSLCGQDMSNAYPVMLPHHAGSNKRWYLTFIGTGISIETRDYAAGTYHIAQNLPYGTHTLKVERDANETPDYHIDGITFSDVTGNTYGCVHDIIFHQPKRPPIPEDAVVLADYMLMADFVAQTQGREKISKGVRAVAATRDQFYTGASAFSVSLDARLPFGYKVTSANAGGQTIKLPFFGTDFLVQHYDNRMGTLSNGLGTDGTSAMVSSDINQGFDGLSKHTGLTLALNEVNNIQADGQNADEMWTAYTHVATPIHTSHHYQPFETPFLNELVGGDRNMEQTNLICSPDGKSWDEVTRDTSYIGKQLLNAFRSAPAGSPIGSSSTATWILDEWRGSVDGGNENLFNKDWAIAYDRIICLVDGSYTLDFGNHHESGAHIILKINGTNVKHLHHPEGSGYGAVYISWSNPFKRGDYVQIAGGHSSDSTTQSQHNHIQILRDTK